MKTTWDELMRYAPEQEIPLPPMQDGECARILNKTMGKIKETKQKPARPVRTVLIAAAIAALLCGSAFAAHSFGWFDRLFGEKATKIYKVIFVVMILSGAVMTSSLAWDISDTFNGLMMLPNLIGVVVLCPMVMKITKNYVNRKIKGIPEEPVLSQFPDIQAEAAASQTDEV